MSLYALVSGKVEIGEDC